MTAPFDNSAVIQYHDHIGILNGRQPVGDNKHGSAVHQSIHTCLYNAFRAGVNGRCRLVQNHDRRVCNGGSGNGEQLPLSL